MCAPTKMIAAALVAAALLCHVTAFYQRAETFHQPLYLSGPTKCFSCERDMIRRAGPEWAWMGKQTKCFDCEKQLARVHPNLANLTHGTKCFDCERELR